MVESLENISDELVNLYYFSSPFCHGENLDMNSRRRIFEERVRHLEKVEWQRWVPFFGTYRFFKDLREGDDRILNEKYSDFYTGSNILYNICVDFAAFAGMVTYFS